MDTSRFETALQAGGIRTGQLDNGVRVAWVETGSGLRFLVALDRGGDIVDARFDQHGLVYLTPNGIKPANPAYDSEFEWLRSWPGGLVTTCGPETIGGPRSQTGGTSGLHGRFSNAPAIVESVINPDPHSGRNEMALHLIIRDSRMFGPTYEVRRRISCTLGQAEIRIEDTVTNHSDTRAGHHWLYHCNLGYPLLQEGARLVYRGKAQYWELPPLADGSILPPITEKGMNRLKRVDGPLKEHTGSAERGLLVEVEPDRKGLCHIGLINQKLGLGLEIEYPAKDLPKLANWQHYAKGCYVTALEPFYGSLLGKPHDRSRMTEASLGPGKSRKYSIKFRVHHGSGNLKKLAAFDDDVTMA
jgi:hypothetical protein